MNDINVFWFLFILVLVTAVFAYLFYQYLNYSENPWTKRNLKRYLLLRNLDDVYKPYLVKYFPFYNALTPRGKAIFERRVQKFIDMKKFEARGVREVTPEMKAAIAGSAIQLTFGYPDVYFTHFWRILVYEDSYYSTITRKYHLGEVNVNGIIVLSWKYFREGFLNPDDGRNLGLHEMAHALRLINIIDNDEYDFYDRGVMEAFENEAGKEMLKARSPEGENSMFRAYSIPNVHEFFSVAVECFFEKSPELKQYNPKIYTLLSRILRLDPVSLYSNPGAARVAS